MPEFYNRFRGRNDLMDYAKVRRGLAVTQGFAHCRPLGPALLGGCDWAGDAGPGWTSALGLNLWPSSSLCGDTCPLRRPRGGSPHLFPEQDFILCTWVTQV